MLEAYGSRPPTCSPVALTRISSSARPRPLKLTSAYIAGEVPAHLGYDHRMGHLRVRWLQVMVSWEFMESEPCLVSVLDMNFKLLLSLSPSDAPIQAQETRRSENESQFLPKNS